MRIHRVIFIIILIVISPACFAQNRDAVWVFGESIGIDYNDIQNPAVTNFTISGGDETYTSISDNSGNLLLYTDPEDYDFRAVIRNKAGTLVTIVR